MMTEDEFKEANALIAQREELSKEITELSDTHRYLGGERIDCGRDLILRRSGILGEPDKYLTLYADDFEVLRNRRHQKIGEINTRLRELGVDA